MGGPGSGRKPMTSVTERKWWKESIEQVDPPDGVESDYDCLLWVGDDYIDDWTTPMVSNRFSKAGKSVRRVLWQEAFMVRLAPTSQVIMLRCHVQNCVQPHHATEMSQSDVQRLRWSGKTLAQVWWMQQAEANPLILPGTKGKVPDDLTAIGESLLLMWQLLLGAKRGTGWHQAVEWNENHKLWLYNFSLHAEQEEYMGEVAAVWDEIGGLIQTSLTLEAFRNLRRMDRLVEGMVSRSRLQAANFIVQGKHPLHKTFMVLEWPGRSDADALAVMEGTG